MFAVNIRLLLAPRWVRWLVMVALMTAIGGPLWIFLISDDGSDWTARAVQIPVLSIGVVTLLIVVQERFRQSFLAVLDGLDATQRRQAIEASQRGAAPTEAPVLSAAVRLCTLLVGTRLRTPTWARWVAYLVPAGAALIAVARLVDHDVWRAMAWLAVAVLMAVICWWDARTLRRLQQQLNRLGATAASSLGEVPTLAESEYPSVTPSRKVWLIVVGVVIAMSVIAGAAAYLMERAQPGHGITGRSECGKAITTLAVFSEREDLTNSQSILPGGPSLADYEKWSNEIRTRAAQVTRSDLAPRAQHIAELSGQAVSVVRETRKVPGTQREQLQQQVVYAKLIAHMYDEATVVLDVCHS
jgi:hypothetical protein